jgi:hypothetical protein
MNTLLVSPVMPGMKFHRQNGLPDAPAGQQDHSTPVRRRYWRPRRRRDREDAWQGPDAGVARDQTAPHAVHADTVDASATAGGTIPGDMVAAAVQLAIGLLTASLDSAQLQAWAVRSLPLEDPVALGDLLAGLHIVSRLLLDLLHEATEEPPAATLQRLAIAAETSRDTPSGGPSSAHWPAV